MAESWDVAVLGGGPAGAAAAIAAAQAGARTVLLERGRTPRYKTCGGGLVGVALAHLPAGMHLPLRGTVDLVEVAHRGRRGRVAGRRGGPPLLAMSYRAELDHALLQRVRCEGVHVVEGCAVTDFDQSAAGARLGTTDGIERVAAAVIGADGSAGRSAGWVGVRYSQVDLGLEAEINHLPADVAARWHGRALVDFGPLPGSYAWVFPKAGDGGGLSAGVIGDRRHGAALRGYLRDFLADVGLDGAGLDGATRTTSGHLTRVRDEASPLHRGRLAVAGDAAGLLEPWTREGISFALRSGTAAGRAAARAARAGPGGAGEESFTAYARWVNEKLEPEMRAGRLLLTGFSRHPRLFYTSFTRVPPAQALFARVTRGEGSLAGAARPVPRALLSRL